jgi:multidrug resistance protein EbrB
MVRIGTALTAIIGVYLFQESFNVVKTIGLILVILGIILLNTSQQKEKEVKRLKVKEVS